MSLPIQIQDGIGSKQKVAVQNNALLVSPLSYPPMGEQKVYPFRQYMTLDGTPTGTSSMKVAGTLAAPVPFYVPADQADDRYITALSFVIAGAAPVLNQFAAVTALVNGCNLYYSRPSGRIVIHDTLKSNFDFVRLCFGNPAFGATTNSFYASNVSGTSEAYIPVLDLTKLVPPFGIKLNVGSADKMVLEIRDNTTAAGIVAFDVICYGFDRIP